MTKSFINNLTHKIIGAAIEVQREMGPCHLESVYHNCLMEEFRLQHIDFISQMVVTIPYKGILLESNLKNDFLVENVIVVELKAVKEMIPLYDAQIISYMKLLNAPKGILINFHSSNIFYEGQKTFVNALFRELPD